MKTLRPFFTYFGGKWRAAKHYPAPEFETIIEPFAGSAGYALRHYTRNVILNDLDPVVAGTWDYIIRAPESEIEALPVYDGSWESVDELHIPQEAKWLIGWWLNKGAARPCKKPSKWVRDMETIGENAWGAGVRGRIASQQRHIRHWVITDRDYSRLPNMRGTWFVDPPYQEAGRAYKHGAGGINFDELASWCEGRPGQSIVCENKGADWLPFQDFRDIKGTAGAHRTGVSREVLWEGGTAALKEANP